MRSTLRKALDILELHGFRALAVRVARKAHRVLGARWSAMQQRLSWQLQVVRDAPATAVHFPPAGEPVVTILLLAQSLRSTRNTLYAIARATPQPPFEVVLVVDPSDRDVIDYAQRCRGLVVLHSAGGFAERSNAGARIARGSSIAVLIARVVPLEGWLAHLMAPLAANADIVLSGAQLRSSDGRLNHGGGVLLADGTTAAAGIACELSQHAYAYLRDVAFVTPRCWLIRADALRAIGGVPLGCAGADATMLALSRALRERGERVVYQPLAVAYDGAPQPRTLAPDVELAARTLQGERRILIVDSHIPFDDRDAGSRRIAALARLMRTLRFDVLFVPSDGVAHEPYTSRLRADGIDVIAHSEGGLAAIRELSIPIDIAWICRPELFARYAPALATVATKRIYDTVDLHHLRERGEEAVARNDTGWQHTRATEIACAESADRTIVCTEEERDVLGTYGVYAAVVPVIESPRASARSPFGDRHGVLFVGNYKHRPNVDAAQFLCSHIMPLLWALDSSIELTLAGSDPTVEVLQLRSARVHVPGYISDIAPLFDRSRIFLAPLRYGAGLKGKIVQSAAMGLPIVTTAIGAEGTGFIDGSDLLIAKDASAFCERAMELYRNQQLWERISAHARTSAQRFSPHNVTAALAKALAFDA